MNRKNPIKNFLMSLLPPNGEWRDKINNGFEFESPLPKVGGHIRVADLRVGESHNFSLFLSVPMRVSVNSRLFNIVPELFRRFRVSRLENSGFIEFSMSFREKSKFGARGALKIAEILRKLRRAGLW